MLLCDVMYSAGDILKEACIRGGRMHGRFCEKKNRKGQ